MEARQGCQQTSKDYNRLKYSRLKAVGLKGPLDCDGGQDTLPNIHTRQPKALQCVAACCTLLQCVAVCACDGSQDALPNIYTRQPKALQCVAVCCSVLQCVAVHCSAVCD